jgi:hypothetical protein
MLRLGRALLVAMLVFAAAASLSAQSAAASSQAAEGPAPPPPLSYSTWLRLRSNPGAWREFQSRLSRPASRLPVPSLPPTSPWQRLTNQPPFNAGAMLLLTDGTVMVQDDGSQASGSANWWRLTPDLTMTRCSGTSLPRIRR